jgi:Putative peptidoglycan binding domain
MTLTYVGAGTTPSKGPTPGIENWKHYVLGRWPGGIDLGSFGVRNMRNSSKLSVHAVGRAWDWRYADPGPGRAAADEAIAYALDHHEALGIQAVHDYVNCTIWRSSRAGMGPAWKRQKPSSDMGQGWAKWLHWEVHPDAALHTATVEQIIAGTPQPKPRESTSASLPLPKLKRGDVGSGVTLLQEVLSFWRYYSKRIDGEFGPLTEAAVAAWQVELQQYNCGEADGIYGPRTHAAAVAFYAGVGRLQAAA